MSTKNHISEASFYEYRIPNTRIESFDDFTKVTAEKDGLTGNACKRDTIQFMVRNQTWTIKKLFIDPDGHNQINTFDCCNEARSGKPVKESDWICLQANADIERVVADADAEAITYLLQLALAQKVTWSELGFRGAGGFALKQARSVRIANHPNPIPTFYNSDGGQIKKYLEASYPVFQQDPKWWKMTLDWYAFGCENNVVEVSGLIFSMLLERATIWIDKATVIPPQISASLRTSLSDKDKRNDLAGKIKAFFQEKVAPEWDDDRNQMLMNSLRSWNDGMSYKKKVKRAFESYSLDVPKNSVLDDRNALAHNGKVSNTPDLQQYDQEVRRCVSELLLKLLDYSGPYYAPGSQHDKII
tara:strand:+ start:267 stop:1340 length:1074 start_codon:yes stop_codon:yes gene_type:complete